MVDRNIHYNWLVNCTNVANKCALEERKRKITECLAALLLLEKKRKKCRQRKKFWVSQSNQNRPLYGFYHVTLPRLKLDNVAFTNYFRMSPTQFEQLLNLVAPKIVKQCLTREPVHPEQRLAVTLRYLASGDTMTSMSCEYLLGLTTVSHIIQETCSVIWEVLYPLILLPCKDEGEWKKVAKDFQQKFYFPHCIGAIDAKHVVIQSPDTMSSQQLNCKGNHAVIFLAVCDANYTFRFIDIAVQDRNRGGIFRKSAIGQKLESKSMNIPKAEQVYKEGPYLPYVIVGDEAFPLTYYLMRPYPERCILTTEQQIYNYRLNYARKVIDNSFGVLISQWKIFRRPIVAKIDKVYKMIQATVCLHNWLRKQDYTSVTYITPDLVDHDGPNGSVEGLWRREVDDSSALKDMTNCSSNTNTRLAASLRDEFCHYFNEEGAIPCQFIDIYI